MSDKTFGLTVTEELTIPLLVHTVFRTMDFDDQVEVLKEMDDQNETWEFTVKAYEYFKKQMENCPEEER